MMISLIAAVGKNNVIGSNGDLPWYLPDDMAFFSKTTKGHHVLMGRKNYDSIPAKYRPLPGRVNLVVTRNRKIEEDGIQLFHTIENAVEFAKSAGEEELFIIGGGEIYMQTLSMADRLYITHVDANPTGDAHFPKFDAKKWKTTELLNHPEDERHDFAFKICIYDKI
ncbi:MAG: dihydrofolate reductase [Salibacteraceae bacterium]